MRSRVMTSLSLIVIISSAACAAEYSADVVERSAGNTQTSRLYVQGVKQRMDTTVQNVARITISRPDKGVAWLIDSGEKTYMTSPVPRNDKPQMPKWGELSKKLANIKRVGKESVNGYVCDKYRISLDTKGSKLGYVLTWVSPKLVRELKSERHSPEGISSIETRNIRESKQSASLFELPKGYKEFKGNPMPKTPGK